MLAIQQQPKQQHNYIQVKLDVSIIQQVLNTTIHDLYTKITHLQSTCHKLTQQQLKNNNENSKIYERVQQIDQKYGLICKEIQEKVQKIMSQGVMKGNAGNLETFVEKTPKQMLDHIQNRLQLNLSLSPRGVKDMDVNCSPPNTDRLVQTFRVKESDKQLARDSQQILDQKVYSIYQKTVEKIQEQLTQLRKDFRMQITELVKSSTGLDHKSLQLPSGKQVKGIQQQNGRNLKLCNDSSQTRTPNLAITHQNLQSIQKQQLPSSSSTKQIKNKSSDSTPSSACLPPPSNIQQPRPSSSQHQKQAQQSSSSKQSSSTSLVYKQQIKQFLNQLKKQVKNQLNQTVKSAQQRFQQISRTNSVIADHLVSAKKTMEDLMNDKDSIKLEMSGIREKTATSERQLCLLIDSNNDHKNKLKTLQNSITKLSQQIKQKNLSNNTIKQSSNEDEAQSSNGSKRDAFRESNSSFRPSIQGNLNSLRNNSILKVNNNRIDSVQQSVRNLGNKYSVLIDRVNKMQDQKKKWEMSGLGSTLPKIDKQNKSNVSPIQIIRKQIKKVNDDIIKTNQKLSTTKTRLDQLYESHAEIPNKIQQIYVKIREKNELQQDRLIQLIKQLINRILSDPFDNNFTNRLKRQINVKFLQIKHEYNCILKEIQSKVQNRAQITELQKISHKFQQSIIQAKTMVGKKCDTQDFKKGVKYLQGKIKEVFQFAKSQTVALANEQKQYIGAKKQPLH